MSLNRELPDLSHSSHSQAFQLKCDHLETGDSKVLQDKVSGRCQQST